MNNADRSAYPVEGSYAQHEGLTKRELFAAMAMQGFNANNTLFQEDERLTATISVQFADALLAELEKGKESK